MRVTVRVFPAPVGCWAVEKGAKNEERSKVAKRTEEHETRHRKDI
jgi:hypothetical protein